MLFLAYHTSLADLLEETFFFSFFFFDLGVELPPISITLLHYTVLPPYAGVWCRYGIVQFPKIRALKNSRGREER